MSAPSHEVPGSVKAFLVLCLVDVVLRVFGLGRALDFADWLVDGREPMMITDSRQVDLTAKNLATAAAFYPRRAQCLEQSIALYVLLRRNRIPAELKVGVQPLPFYAHAWVELHGRSINESQSRVQQLVAFNRARG